MIASERARMMAEIDRNVSEMCIVSFTALVMREESLSVVTNVGIRTCNLKPMIEGEYTT
jgi:hypothetical protein